MFLLILVVAYVAFLALLPLEVFKDWNKYPRPILYSHRLSWNSMLMGGLLTFMMANRLGRC